MTITTGDKMFAGTTRNLNMVFTDVNGFVFPPIEIKNDGTMFKRNSIIEKKISLLNGLAESREKIIKFKESQTFQIYSQEITDYFI